MVTSGCYVTTPWMNRLETPRDTYRLSRMAFHLILPVSCTFVWPHISDVPLAVALCPLVVVLIIWPYIMRFLALGYGKGQGVCVNASWRHSTESKDLCCYLNNTSGGLCSHITNHKSCGSQHALTRKTVKWELASFQQTVYAKDLNQIRSNQP